MLLGEIIFKYREEHQLSQRQFAMKCGLSNGYISMIEKNINPATKKPPEVSLPKLKSIANAMHMTADELMRMADGETIVSMDPESSAIPRTIEARIVSAGMDKMSQEDRDFALEMFRRTFAHVYNQNEGNDTNDAQH